MNPRQISVFLENRSGRLKEALEPLAAANINLRAISIADTTDFGILRLLVDNSDQAVQILKDAGFTCTINEVLAVEIANVPGSLAQVVRILAAENININYLYPFSYSSLLLLQTCNNTRAKQALTAAGFTVLAETALGKM